MWSTDTLTRFVRDGYVVLPKVVPEALLGPVDAEFSRVLAAHPDPGGGPHHSAFVPPSTVPACLAALDDSPARSLAEHLVAPNALEHRFDHVQLCTNQPGNRHRPRSPHIDGMGHGPPRPETFTMLAGIYLGDEGQPDRGNLYVWPGSHLLHASIHRDYGTDVLLPSGGHIGMFDSELDLGPSHPVYADRGDLLLAHYLTGHNSGGNQADIERRIVYFRLGVVGHRDHWEQTMTDPWFEYAPALRQLHKDMHRFRSHSRSQP